METKTNEKVKNPISLNPQFIDKEKLHPEQISDPDYRLKLLESLYGSQYPITCSKCHHCR
jgi:hypothetical protein